MSFCVLFPNAINLLKAIYYFKGSQNFISEFAGFVPTGYTANYLAATAPPPPPHQPTHNHELVPVYPNQPLQVVYHQSQPTPQNPIIYQNQPPVIYATHNTVYSPQGAATAAYPPPQMTPQHMTAQTVPPYPQVSALCFDLIQNSSNFG